MQRASRALESELRRHKLAESSTANDLTGKRLPSSKTDDLTGKRLPSKTDDLTGKRPPSSKR